VKFKKLTGLTSLTGLTLNPSPKERDLYLSDV